MSLGYSGRFTADGDAEFFCKLCSARCTRNSDTGIEYGHLIGCPNRPDEFDTGSSDGKRYYRPDNEADAEGGASA